MRTCDVNTYLSIHIVQYAIIAPVSDHVPDPGSSPLNSLYKRVCTHTRSRIPVHVHIGNRQRLKWSPTSIALAINALSASASPFCLSSKSTIPHYRRAHPFVLSSIPISHYSASGCYFFFASQGECFLHTSISNNLSDFRFRIFLMVTFRFAHYSFIRFINFSRRIPYCGKYCKITRNIAKTSIINYWT